MARLRRFLMLERERAACSDPAAPPVSSRFEALGPPAAPPEPDPFAPPPEPDVVLEVETPDRAEPRRDEAHGHRPARGPDQQSSPCDLVSRPGGDRSVGEALAAEIAAMSVERDEIGVARAQERYPRPIDRLAALVAVGPVAGWSPAARVRLVAGVAALAIAALSFAGGVGPRVLQGALGLLLLALFVRS